jgi:hypothetical protein
MILEIHTMFSFFKKKSPPPEAQSVPAHLLQPTLRLCRSHLLLPQTR